MGYIVRLRRSDGSVLNLPEVFHDPVPLPESEVALHVDGMIVRAKVERRSRWHSTSPETPVDTVDVVMATQLQE